MIAGTYTLNATDKVMNLAGCDLGELYHYDLSIASMYINLNRTIIALQARRILPCSRPGLRYAIDPCLLCIYMPAIDRSLSALYIHAGD